jgi:hypothetical protein
MLTIREDNMTDLNNMIDRTRALLEVMSPWMPYVSALPWDGTHGYLPIIRRGSLVRQFECLEVALDLVQNRCGYAAVPLLRPACEELLWLRYLESLSAVDARALAGILIEKGLFDDLRAQADEVGAEVMSDMGLLPAFEAFREKQSDLLTNIHQLAEKLGWKHKGKMPSTWFIAQATESETLYQFLYHATSRYVHFSAVELARHGWGQPGRLELSSATYERVWAMFSLTWGTRLFGWTVDNALTALRAEGVPEPDHLALQSVFDGIAEVPLLPLVTPDELIWASGTLS